MNSLNSLVSIILPNYNHADYLQERLESIYNQSYQNFEVIILDDCSTDNSLSLLNAYKKHPKTKGFEVNSKNSGSPFKQWQKGLNLAKGTFIWIAESDDFCDTNFLETQLVCLQTADVAVAKTLAFIDNTISHEVKHPLFDEEKQTDALLYCPILNVSSVLFKAALLKNLKNDYYATFKIMGDRVFYFEYFKDSKIVLNKFTQNYFRQSHTSLSKLDNRSLRYYHTYFHEHCQFIEFVKRIDETISAQLVKDYINKFYKRISSRLKIERKRSILYLLLYVKYKFKLLINR